MAEDVTYLTAEGAKKLREELEELKTVKRPELAARLRHAIEQGDISENADYSSAKEDQAFMEGRIQDLESMLLNVVIIDEMERKKGVVNIGSVVTLQEVGEDETEVYTIVGTQEADPMNNKISTISPMGEALCGQKKGKTVEINTPGGLLRMKIIDVK